MNEAVSRLSPAFFVSKRRLSNPYTLGIKIPVGNHTLVTNDEYALPRHFEMRKPRNNRNSMSKPRDQISSPKLHVRLEPTGVATPTAIHGNAAVGGSAEVPKLP